MPERAWSHRAQKGTEVAIESKLQAVIRRYIESRGTLTSKKSGKDSSHGLPQRSHHISLKYVSNLSQIPAARRKGIA